MKRFVAPFGLALLAAGIRLATLAHQSFWLDEAYTVRLVKMSFGGMLRAIPKTESTPPLFYALEWTWARVFGYGEVPLRMISALAGIATVLAVYATAQMMGRHRAAIIAGALVALSPILIWYSQEARAYSLATLLATLTILCLTAWTRSEDRRWLACWAVCGALGLATHYFVGFVLAPEIAWLARRRRLRAAVLPVAAGIALLPLALAQRGTGHADYIAQGSLATRVLQIPKQLLVGFASPGQIITGIAAALLAGTALAAAIRLGKTAGQLLALALAAVAAPIALALIGIDFVNTRNVLVALPPALLVLALGFDAQTRPALTSTALCVVFAAIVVQADTSPIYERDDWRGVSRALAGATGARALVVDPGSAQIALAPYMRGLRALGPPVAVREVDVVVLGPHTTGHGIQPPPRQRANPPIPTGFSFAGIAYTDRYEVLRYRAAEATGVTSAELQADRLAPGPAAVLLQANRGAAESRARGPASTG